MSVREYSQRGGAKIGWVSASWPLASLQITSGSLTVISFGTYAFAPGDVDAIEPVGSIPILTTGIRIHHTRADFPEEIVFYCGGGRERVLQAASAAGFRVGEPIRRASRGFPVRIGAIVAFVLPWNVLFLIDLMGKSSNAPGTLGPCSLLAMVLAFSVATLIPRSVRLQEFVMRDGHDVGEIRGFLRLTQFITGILAVATGLAQ